YTLTPDCLASDGTYDVVALAFDAASHVIAYASVPGLVPPGGTMVATVNLPAWETTFVGKDVTYQNAPAHAALLTGSLAPWHDWVPGRATSEQSPAITAGGGAKLSFAPPSGAMNRVVTAAVLKWDDQPPSVGVGYERAGPPFTADTLDLGKMLPRVHSIAA